MVITKSDLLEFFTNAPGVLLSMLHTQFIMNKKGLEEHAALMVSHAAAKAEKHAKKSEHEK